MDGVAMKRGELVLQRLHFEVRNRGTADVGHAHAKHQ